MFIKVFTGLFGFPFMINVNHISSFSSGKEKGTLEVDMLSGETYTIQETLEGFDKGIKSAMGKMEKTNV